MHIAYPSSYPPGYKLQKPSKESGIFQSLGTINFVFLLKGRVKMKGHLTMHPKYASGYTLFKIGLKYGKGAAVLTL